MLKGHCYRVPLCGVEGRHFYKAVVCYTIGLAQNESCALDDNNRASIVHGDIIKASSTNQLRPGTLQVDPAGLLGATEFWFS